MKASLMDCHEAVSEPPPPYSCQGQYYEPSKIHLDEKYACQTRVSSISSIPRPRAVAIERLRTKTAVIDCPRCRMRAQTDIEQYDTGMTIMLRLMILPLGLFDKPWRWSMNTAHFCGNCNSLLALYHPFSGDAKDKTPRNYGPAGDL